MKKILITNVKREGKYIGSGTPYTIYNYIWVSDHYGSLHDIENEIYFYEYVFYTGEK